MTRSNDLTALVGSRICHDLANPLSAIGNGVELLGMMGNTGGEEMQLINDAVANATARINFFRIAYGAGTADQLLSRAQITSTLDGVASGGRMSYDWQLTDDLPRTEVRVAFLILQCLETAMPRGGTVTVSDRWTISVDGDLRLEPELWERLPEPPSAMTAAQVQFGLLADALADTGRSFQIDQRDDGVTVTF